ncbi:MAG TPA: hypothetical protein VKN82_01675 [Desulfohalobiaceae bacterium]|nr:hypothetical protein [Desulfohalobiaceae bacterium]
MTRNEIMNLPEKDLLGLIFKNFGIKISGLDDNTNMSSAWQISQELVKQGWGVDIRLTEGLINVDGYKFDNGPGTIFAQYGSRPNFKTTVEGICKTSLVALQTVQKLRE